MRHKKFRAESIMETIISITVLTLGVAASLTILRTSLLSNSIIGEKIVALNLAIEGIEALKNIRDTNYLRYASDPDSCWANLTATDVADCTPATSIRDLEDYYFTRDLSDDYFEWGLAAASSSNEGNLELYNIDVDDDGAADTEIYAEAGLSGEALSIPRKRLSEEPYLRLFGQHEHERNNYRNLARRQRSRTRSDTNQNNRQCILKKHFPLSKL
jgi:hypothetical protein